MRKRKLMMVPQKLIRRKRKTKEEKKEDSKKDGKTKTNDEPEKVADWLIKRSRLRRKKKTREKRLRIT